MNFRKIIQKLVCKFVFKQTYGEYLSSHQFFSQNGEDIIINSLHPKRGFYVDVGAHKPIEKSNTWLLYKNGWRGINIEANQVFINEFNKLRPLDQNICKLVSDKKVMHEFMYFNEPAVNCIKTTASKDVIKHYRHIKTEKTQSLPLEELLATCKIPDEGIDLLDVDCEGHDLNILKSNNWKKFRPALILAENNDHFSNEIEEFLAIQNYSLLLRLSNTLVFKSNEKKSM